LNYSSGYDFITWASSGKCGLPETGFFVAGSHLFLYSGKMLRGRGGLFFLSSWHGVQAVCIFRGCLQLSNVRIHFGSLFTADTNLMKKQAVPWSGHKPRFLYRVCSFQ
jgi:hypothetical protein